MAKRALRLASRDLSVLPMHSAHRGRCTCPKGNACERAGKHPITRHGVNDATTKRDQIDKLVDGAIPTQTSASRRAPRRGILVLDIDPRNGGTRDPPTAGKGSRAASSDSDFQHWRRRASIGFLNIRTFLSARILQANCSAPASTCSRTAASWSRRPAAMRPATGTDGRTGNRFAISNQLPCRNRG